MPEERIPYCRQTLGEEEIEAVTAVLRSGWITRGPLAGQLETRCAERLQASHAVACSSGSAALEIALRGLGIGPGDEVIVPTLTWGATAGAVLLVGATPVFCDVDELTHNATPVTVEACWSKRTRAVIVVDFAGIPCDLRALGDLTRARGAFLIEDAAHAFGSLHASGIPVGGDGTADVVTFSFHPAKTITTAEGGLLTCEDGRLAERLACIRSGGVTRGFEGSRGGFDVRFSELGSNHHLSEIHAALGLVQLDRLDDLIARRREAARELTDALGPHAHALELPQHPPGSCWNLYIALLAGDAQGSDPRDGMLAHLSEAGIAAHLHYPLLHRQPLFAPYAGQRSFPVAERYERRALTLPLFPELTPAQIARVAGAVGEALPLAIP
jgi:UDP-4-amino-4-deoxy-L-arabinose-oxoglutarate aminotransferase